MIGAEDDFGAMGGNSLSALRACRALAAHTTAPINDTNEQKRKTKTNDENAVDADDAAGMHAGEAAALIVSEFSPEGGKACAFGRIDGPLAPCELLQRPVLRDYAAYLARAGVRCRSDAAAVARDDREENQNASRSDGIHGSSVSGVWGKPEP
jgi:hypothetical protein